MVYLASSYVGLCVLPTAAIPFKAFISLKICQHKIKENYKGKEINALPNEMSWLSVQTKKLVKDNNLQLDKFVVQ